MVTGHAWAVKRVRPSVHMYTSIYKVRILVAGNTNCGVIEPEQLINKFVYNDYQPVRNIAVPLDIITISIDNIRVNIDIKDISTMMNAVDTYDRLLQVELAQYPHVGVMLIYNPTVRYSFEGVKEIVDIHLPRLLQESWATAKSVPVTIVGDECLLRGEREREVSYCMAREFADERGIPVIEINGKKSVNVELAFLTLVGEVIHFKNLT